MPSLVCPNCNSSVPRTAAGCAGCGVLFDEIRCDACEFVGVVDRFPDDACPRCSAKQLVIVPREGDVVEEVGAEAFADVYSLLDDDARRHSPAPAQPTDSEPTEPKSPPAAAAELPAERWAARRQRLPAAVPDDTAHAKRDAARAEQQPTARAQPQTGDVPTSPPSERVLKRTAPSSKSVARRDPPKPAKTEAERTPTRDEARPEEPPRTRPVPVAKSPASDQSPLTEDEPPEQHEAVAASPTLKRRSWRPQKLAQMAAEKSPVSMTPSESVQPGQRTRGTSIAWTMPRLSFGFATDSNARVRWAVAAGSVVVITLVALVVYLGSTSRPKVKPVASTPTDQVDRARLEEQANRLLQAAIDFYTTKQFPQAVATLQDLVNQFGGTQASQQALLALDRQQRGEPLFGEMQAPSPERPSDEQVAAAPKKKPVIGIPSAPPSVEPSANTAPTDLVTTSPPDRPRAPPRGSTLAKSDARPRALPPGFTAVDTSGVHSSGWPIEIMCLKDSSHMMLVPEGDFEMGSDVEASNAQPAHRVRLKTYYIDKFEITLGQYEGFLDQRRLEKNPYRALSPAVSSVAKSGKHPVVGTAWRDARAYALWAGKNLPTEAQWEKAARGTDRRLYPWGTDPPVWGRPRQPRQIDPVGSFTWDVSVFGCYDMAGNAWEWCADWFDPNYYRTSPTDDPDGPASFLPPVEHLDPERALRGGSPRWNITWRAPGGLNIEPLHVGFRCVLEVEKTSPLAAATVPGQTPTSTSPKPPAPQPERRPAKLPPGGFRF